ncbi:MAG: hypothetical protein COV70_02450 [Parcubacteria group bacterium CG11_big_fil_rev_8_21_14_0_20_39_22]|nr:MAG: hypothetical protein COV70_02450 [Parcubacteria group bacterium CG11_big_fil_rev_8_21_14_0_20_39_22]
MSLNFLKTDRNLMIPDKLPFEIVERKGVGHPDSLADALSNEISVYFSKHCIDNFGIILHHNFDKLYIGGGNFTNNFGTCDRLKPIMVQVNGRISDRFGRNMIEIESIQKKAVENYLCKVLPNITKDDLVVISNATQFHRNPRRFSPRNRRDVPDADRPMANDTSLCVSHWPPTATESLVYRLEKYFWERTDDGYLTPRFTEIGGDIKVFAIREDKHIDIIMSVPTLSEKTKSFKHYLELIYDYKSKLTVIAKEIVSPLDMTVSIEINPQKNPYMLGIGSCIECGEEGVVGRGNSILGIIAPNRCGTQESWAGKNPVYHTGRVWGYLTAKLAQSISTRLNVKCSVSAITQCGDSLIPPKVLHISSEEHIGHNELEEVVKSELLSADYVNEILNFRPWSYEL